MSAMNLSATRLKGILDPISHSLLGVSLSLNGEPFLNPNIISLIEYINSKNIGVSFPTNFSIKLSKTQAERIVTSGLDCIQVALDGISRETYNRYRVGGNLELVLSNVKLLADTKKELRRHLPKIIWKYIVFDYNRHEINRIEPLYKNLGFDGYELVYDIGSTNYQKAGDKLNKNIIKAQKGCFWLWNTMVIRWDGGVQPCCFKSGFELGNAIKDNIIDLWHSAPYKSLREGFAKRNFGQKMHPVCKNCIGLSGHLKG